MNCPVCKTNKGITLAGSKQVITVFDCGSIYYHDSGIVSVSKHTFQLEKISVDYHGQ